MTRKNRQLEFINKFVDSVTVRPFLEDLQRARQVSRMFGQLPRTERYETPASTTEAA